VTDGVREDSSIWSKSSKGNAKMVVDANDFLLI
jgi:hypothetical protein